MRTNELYQSESLSYYTFFRTIHSKKCLDEHKLPKNNRKYIQTECPRQIQKTVLILSKYRK